MMYPMASPMGPLIGYGPAAMTPGAPLTATGDMPSLHNSYTHGAVGGPVQAPNVQSSSSQETKGYFDQVYMSPNPNSYYGGGSAGGEESGAGGIAKEILKDSSQFGKDESPGQDITVEEEVGGEANAEARPAFLHSQSVALVGHGKAEAPLPALKHANTAPEPLAGR